MTVGRDAPSRARRTPLVLGSIGAVLAGAAAVLPWAEISVSLHGLHRAAAVNGWDAEGKVTLVASVLALERVALAAFLGVAAAARRLLVVVPLAAGLVMVGVAGFEIARLSGRVGGAEEAATRFGGSVDVSVGIGLWLTAVGGVLLVASAAWTLVRPGDHHGGSPPRVGE